MSLRLRSAQLHGALPGGNRVLPLSFDSRFDLWTFPLFLTWTVIASMIAGCRGHGSRNF